MLIGNFQIVSIQVIEFMRRCLKVLGQRVNKFLSNKCRDGYRRRFAYNSRYLPQEIWC